MCHVPKDAINPAEKSIATYKAHYFKQAMVKKTGFQINFPEITTKSKKDLQLNRIIKTF